MVSKQEKKLRKKLFKQTLEITPKISYTPGVSIDINKLQKDIKDVEIKNLNIIFSEHPSNINIEELINKAEIILNIKLPISYKWFLRTYQCATIGIDKNIYGLFNWNYEEGLNSSSVNYEDYDLIWNYLLNKQRCNYREDQLYIAEFTDCSSYYFKIIPNANEYPIIELEEGYWTEDNSEPEVFANTFYEFLVKIVNQY